MTIAYREWPHELAPIVENLDRKELPCVRTPIDARPRPEQKTDTVLHGLVEVTEPQWRLLDEMSRGPPGLFKVVPADTEKPCIVTLRIALRHPSDDKPGKTCLVEIEMIVKPKSDRILAED